MIRPPDASPAGAPHRPYDRIEARASFDAVRYANCWEDADVLCEALRVRPGCRILSVASAGDNVLAMLAEGAHVVAADLSTAQLACLELRVAAFRRLDHDGVLAFLGVRPSTDRPRLYRNLRDDISPAARRFWDDRPGDVEGGVIHAGRFEHYFGIFRTRVLSLIHSRRRVSELMQPRDAADRRGFYDRTWNTLRWRLMFRLFFSRFVMGRMGRDPEFFRYVEGSVADRILARAEHALTALPTHDNPYLDYILNGNYTRALPRYLERHRFEQVRDGLDRLTLHHGSIEKAGLTHGGAGFDGFNLSDVFEYIDADTARAMYATLLRVALPGARLAYWNTLVPRRRPADLAALVRPLPRLAGELHRLDRAFFYCEFNVDEVNPQPDEACSHENDPMDDDAGVPVAVADGCGREPSDRREEAALA
jgi:S-adenosylmethionine:diacylglycerol 3-amino-3-carboxypropyl transferase